MIEVQVKTATIHGRPSWLLGLKGLVLARSEREWYVFVLLPRKTAEGPRYFVVPRDHVAAATWLVHREWETNPDVAPGSRNTPMKLARVSVNALGGYENRWDLLEEGAWHAPILLRRFSGSTRSWIESVVSRPSIHGLRTFRSGRATEVAWYSGRR